MQKSEQYQRELEHIQVSLAPSDVKADAIKKLNKKYGLDREEAMAEDGDISDISSGY